MPNSASWFLKIPGATAETEIREDTNPFALRGIVTPFRRDRRQDFANSTGSDVVLSNVRQILGTRVGELRWFPKFGSLLYLLRHQNIKPVLVYQARAYVVDAIARWESRARVTRVEVYDQPRALVVRAYVQVLGSTVEPTPIDVPVQKAA